MIYQNIQIIKILVYIIFVYIVKNVTFIKKSKIIVENI